MGVGVAAAAAAVVVVVDGVGVEEEVVQVVVAEGAQRQHGELAHVEVEVVAVADRARRDVHPRMTMTTTTFSVRSRRQPTRACFFKSALLQRTLTILPHLRLQCVAVPSRKPRRRLQPPAPLRLRPLAHPALPPPDPMMSNASAVFSLQLAQS
ncbi:hypothetical protein PHLGIDRAFT_453076 [Phlebiopsis gigantea 11061_1 CR5-6]|uniref:Secreted protein n=1 Tax=Phlebiopsis gigantea (strain 11061_1 CR5-6) TaxID=745531 RepID=A0A0C3PJU4_PHLG1|nr:hypothetical protein PHLGIDRAFT_453076 [Phlebiopsis gigantea 11061_1 CR5-6]